MSSNFVSIDLAPKAGFCIKSSLLAPGILPVQKRTSPQTNENLLEPEPSPVPLPIGLKVFINIAWDANVPPPPEGSEDAIQRAMKGDDIDETNSSGWFVPMIVSPGREDKDKAGNPSVAFDCISNTSLKSRTLRDPEFKTFIIELALQRIEDQARLSLSRVIGTPNIMSKGKLLPRRVQIPAAMLPSAVGTPSSSTSRSSSTPLIHEITPNQASKESSPASTVSKPTDLTTELQPAVPKIQTSTRLSPSSTVLPGLRGILKKSSNTTDDAASVSSDLSNATISKSKVDTSAPLDWSWTKDDSGRIRIDVQVPELTLDMVKISSLDVEARRVILAIPNRRLLDINLDFSDAEIASRVSGSYSLLNRVGSEAKLNGHSGKEKRKEEETTRTLQLKRQRDFSIDKADAQWSIGTGTVSIYV